MEFTSIMNFESNVGNGVDARRRTSDIFPLFHDLENRMRLFPVLNWKSLTNKNQLLLILHIM